MGFILLWILRCSICVVYWFTQSIESNIYIHNVFIYLYIFICIYKHICFYICIYTKHLHIYVYQANFSFSIWCFECSNYRIYWKHKLLNGIWIYNWSISFCYYGYFIPLTDHVLPYRSRLLKRLRNYSKITTLRL